MRSARFSFTNAVARLCLLLILSCAGLSAQSQPLKVMSFNIWVGGTRVDFDQIVAAIQLAEADIVGVQESSGNLARPANALGFHYQNRNQIISRFPIVGEIPGGALVDIGSRQVAVYNVHLTPYPYGPYDLRDGASVAEVLANENNRHMNEMAVLFSEIEARMARGTPLFLTGDFNVPSHLDWTAAVADRHFGKVVPWPVSKRLETMGVHDAYRRANPNLAQRPGYTWTPGYPPPVLEDDEKHDRIDFVYYAGAALQLRAARNLGHDAANVNTDMAVTPWGSDHRAVLAQFDVAVDAERARVVPQKATFQEGEPIVVDFAGAAGNAHDWVGLFDVGSPNGPGNSLDWLYTDGTRTGAGGIQSGNLSFQHLPVGSYQARLFFNDGYNQEAAASFHVVAPAVDGVGADRRLYGLN